MRRLVVPVDLGGSPHACALRPPVRPAPAPETVAALVEHYARERMPVGGARLELAYFHGGVPDDALLAAGGDLPRRLACSPVDLDRARVARLQAAGVETVELEVLTFDSRILRDLRRGYSGARARAMLLGLRALGLRTGVVLAPGLPGSTHASSLADARHLAEADPPLADFVRLVPCLALEGAPVCRRVDEGRWVPMHLGEAVTTCQAAMDLLEAGGVPVIRVGLQPGPDVPVRAVAGPVHPDLRGLVEARRFKARMVAALDGLPGAAGVVVRVNPRDLSWARGVANTNVRALRAALGLRALRVEPDAGVPRGQVVVGAGAPRTADAS